VEYACMVGVDFARLGCAFEGNGDSGPGCRRGARGLSILLARRDARLPGITNVRLLWRHDGLCTDVQTRTRHV
jgi:hypothetical protein